MEIKCLTWILLILALQTWWMNLADAANHVSDFFNFTNKLPQEPKLHGGPKNSVGIQVKADRKGYGERKHEMFETIKTEGARGGSGGNKGTNGAPNINRRPPNTKKSAATLAAKPFFLASLINNHYVPGFFFLLIITCLIAQ